MLKRRLIARLDIRNDKLIKPMNLEGVRVVGDPYEFACRYDSEGIDEIVFLDAVASLYGRSSILRIVERAVADVFCPVTIGGGIRSIADARAAFLAGADKIAINTAAIRRPELITELARKFGSQSVVLQIDAKRKGEGWEAYIEGGRQPTGKDVCMWAQEGVELGAGEILLTSIDQEGTRRGFECDLIRRTFGRINVPLIASGGCGRCDHISAAVSAGADAVAMADALHYRRLALPEIRAQLVKAGIPVRTTEMEMI